MIVARIGDADVPRDAVLAWERRRARKALRRLGVRPVERDLGARRTALEARRAELGPCPIKDILETQLRVSEKITLLTVRAARGRRVLSSIRLFSTEGTAAEFAEWFERQATDPAQVEMLKACPDHHVFGLDVEGQQKVIETTGGSPLASRFFIDYDDLTSLTTTGDPDYPIQIAAVAHTGSGVAIGGVRHQFRDHDPGFEAWLTIEFPRFTPPHMVRGHRWHLACEFSNWIEASRTDIRAA